MCFSLDSIKTSLCSQFTQWLSKCCVFRSVFTRSVLSRRLRPLPALSAGNVPAWSGTHLLLSLRRKPGDQAQRCCYLPGVWDQRFEESLLFLMAFLMFFFIFYNHNRVNQMALLKLFTQVNENLYIICLLLPPLVILIVFFMNHLINV